MKVAQQCVSMLAVCAECHVTCLPSAHAQGLAVLGYRVMETVGKEITEINFSRGFAIELGSTLSVVLASVVGESPADAALACTPKLQGCYVGMASEACLWSVCPSAVQGPSACMLARKCLAAHIRAFLQMQHRCTPRAVCA